MIVAGVSGAGKTTIAERIGERRALPHVEIDALHHGPGWVPREEFAADVDAFSAGPRWVTEWQYPSARPVLAARADTLVWLDLPTPLVMARVVRRTVTRRVRGIELWNGNHEPPLRTFLTDDDHIVRWAWRIRHLYRDLVPTALTEHPHLRLVHLRSRGDVRRWLATLEHPAD